MTFFSNPDTNRDRLMSSAVTLCAEVGRDHLTMSMIAKDAEVSRGTLYNKFEDVDGVLAEVWLEVGALWLSELESNAESNLPDQLQRCLAQCITVAPRVPAILEVVEEDVMRAFRSAGSKGRASEVRWAWAMALALGQRFAEQSKLVFNFEMMKTFSDLISQMPDDWPGEFTPVEYNYGPLKIQGSEDEKYERILSSAISAITRSGIANTSMMRICRSARVSPASVTPRFPTYEDVVVEAFNRLVEAVVHENLIAFAPKESDSIAQQFASAINMSFGDTFTEECSRPSMTGDVSSPFDETEVTRQVCRTTPDHARESSDRAPLRGGARRVHQLLHLAQTHLYSLPLSNRQQSSACPCGECSS